ISPKLSTTAQKISQLALTDKIPAPDRHRRCSRLCEGLQDTVCGRGDDSFRRRLGRQTQQGSSRADTIYEAKKEYATESRHGGEPCQPHPGTQCHRCGCSLPGLTGFTADRCEGTGRAHHDKPAWRRAAPLYRLIDNLQPLTRGQASARKLPPVSKPNNERYLRRIAAKPPSQNRASVRG